MIFAKFRLYAKTMELVDEIVETNDQNLDRTNINTIRDNTVDDDEDYRMGQYTFLYFLFSAIQVFLSKNMYDS